MSAADELSGTDLVRRIRAMSPKRRRAVTALLRKQGVDLSALTAVTARPRKPDEPVPLSYAQQRLWFLAQLEGTSSHYNIPVAVRLHGDLDLPALRRALTEVVRRHEALRTRLVAADGVPQQVIGDASGFELRVADVTDPAQLARLCRAETVAPFDLAADSLIRALVLTESTTEHVLVVTMHHTVSDGWSLGVLFRDLSALYGAFRAGRPSPLAPLPIQYADYALWQREWLDDGVREEQVEYWRGQLAGVDPRLTLPTDRPRPENKTYRGTRAFFGCPPELMERLGAVAAGNRVTLYMVLLAAYDIVLQRYTGEHDLAVGTVVANRNQHEVEDLVGLFANTVVIRADLAGDPAFPDLLAAVKRTALAAFDHQDVPFEMVVDALQLERSLSHSPVFQTLFVVQEASTGQDVSLGGLTTSAVGFDFDITKFDVTLDLRETPTGLLGAVEYNTDLFDAATIERFIGHYTTLLAAIAAAPDSRLSALDMVGAEERELVLRTWNDTAREYSRDSCLHQLFEAQVRRHPERVAVVDGEREISYAQLDAWANRIGHALRDLGVGPDTVVGLCTARSAEMVAGIYGILKAGGAYMPIEPSYPAARITELVESSGVGIVLAQPEVDAAPLVGTTVLRLHGDGSVYDATGRELAADRDGAVAVPGLGARNLAYVIHTSGSTGRPKGVMIEHRAAVNRIEWMQNEYSLSERDVVLQKTPFSFDVSVWEFFWPLLAGARLVLARPEGHKDPAYLASAIRRFGVTTLHFVPSMLRAMLTEPDWSACESVRQVFCSGEALPPDLCSQHYERHSAPLHNLYGPTEAAVDVSHWTCPPGTPALVPIGRPIQNIQLYVLDEALRPQGIGCVGQLHIAGDGLARGYLNQPELTRERFVPNPFATAPDARMYRTGDLVRWLADGTLEFLGRADEQVKLRGFRIEPGEIEHRLSEHPAVRECAVLLRADQRDDPRLVAYVVLAPDAEDAEDAEDADLADPRTELSRFLARALPEHMVPSAFVVLDALPVTAHGKLDRKALPAPGIDDVARQSYAAPSTDAERLLAGLWADLLGFDEARIGAQDNLFALGGHSLLIPVLVARLAEHGFTVLVRDVFGAPTLADLAALLTAGATEEYRVPANPIPADCRRLTPELLPLVELTQEQIDAVVATVPGGAANVADVYPLASAQEGILFHHLLDPENDPYLVSILFTARDEAAAAAFIDALRAMVARHDVLRTAVLTTGLPEPVQVVYRHAELDVRRVRLAPGDTEAQARELLHGAEPIPVDRAPLQRLVVAEDPDSERRYLVLTAHHLIEDATSIRLSMAEVTAHLAGQADRLAPAAPYRDFVAHTRHRLASDDAEAYFRAALGDVVEPTTPFGLTEVRGDARRFSRLRRELPGGLADSLRVQAKRLRVSPACLFHAAYARVVAATSGREDIVFGTVLSGRLQGVPGVEGMLGNFINTLPLRLRLAGLTVRELVDEVDRGLAGLIAREQTPLSLVQRCSGTDGEAPLFTAVVNVRHFEPGHDAPDPSADDFGVRWLAETDATNYPLSVALDDFGDSLSLHIRVDERISPHDVLDCVEAALAGLLAGLAADDGAGTKALDIEVLSTAARDRLLAAWRGPVVPVPDVSVVAAFEEQARLHPGRTALVYEDETLTYGELNERANRLAHWLVARDVRPDDVVAVRLPRSLDLLVAVYGVLKAGAAYLPVEPDLPVERAQHMLAQATPALVLTELPDIGTGPGGDPGESDDPGVAVSGDRAAYVLYTSGSTGRPKGVVVSHRAIVNRITGMQQRYQLTEQDRVLHKTAASFDVSVWELLWPLAAGAGLVIARPDGHKDPAYLAELIRRSDVTTLHFVPSMLRLFLEEPTAARCTSLRRVLCGGEALPVSLAREFHRALDAELHHLYGPVEATIDVTENEILPGTDRVTMGYPVPNTRVYVLDSRRRIVPAGVPGELYLAGAQLARGYVGRDDLTAERFVPDPFVSAVERMYRTGDVVRWWPDRGLEFLGRTDDQVKVRGVRIELGEVETALLRHDAVAGAVVLPHGDGEERALIGYVRPSAEWLRESARRQVAEHLTHWRQIFEKQGAPDEGVADDLNLVGWDSSYTGVAIPDEEMREWIDGTVDRIVALRPRRLLEIGCGTGLLLFRYAERCEAVYAVDLAAAVLADVRAGVDRRGWSHVALAQGDALTAPLPDESFDTIVINSVAQYFPSGYYLEQVIARLLPLLSDGGRLFIGDVRNLDLLTAHVGAIERAGARGRTTVAALAAQVRRRVRQETELLVSPTYFARLSERFPELGSVDLMVKRGVGENEMLAYRYDVVLTKGMRVPAVPLPWRDAGTTDELRALLDAGAPDRFGVAGLVNPRIADDVRVAAQLAQGLPNVDIEPLPGGARLDEPAAAAVRDVESVLAHAERLGYRVCATWSQHRPEGIDLVFGRDELPEVRAREPYTATRTSNFPQLADLGPGLSAALREHLSASLSAAMVPALFMVLEDIPVTRNGKVDKRALPAPGEDGMAKVAYAPPRTEAERVLCRLVEEMFEISRVGLDDDFFTLGVHSLLAVRLTMRVEREFGVRLPLRLMLTGATMRETAAALEALRDSPDAEAAEAVPAGAPPISLQQSELWFLDRPEHARLGTAYDNVQVALRIDGELDRTVLARAVRALVDRHEVLRTSYRVEGEEVLQVVGDNRVEVGVEQVGEDALEDWLRQERVRPFDPADPRVLRVHLLPRPDGSHVLTFTRPWGVFDGYSMNIVLAELFELYLADSEHRAPDLAPLVWQYGDFARWQRQAVSPAELDRQRAYWRERLAGLPPCVHLHTDHPRGPVRSYQGAAVDVAIPQEVLTELRELGRRRGATLYMTLLSAFAVLLGGNGDSTDLAIASPVTNRPRIELEPLVGYFSNRLAMRLDVTPSRTFADVLGQARQVTAEAHEHKDLPFTEVVRDLVPTPVPAYPPLCQVVFNLLPALPAAGGDAPAGVSVTPLPGHPGVAKFDLNLVVRETGDGLRGHLEYSTDLFAEQTVRDLVRALTRLLRAIVADPDRSLSRLRAVAEEAAR